MNDYDDYDDLTPAPRSGRSRRERLDDEMPEWKLRKKHKGNRQFKSKPKGFKHNRRGRQKDGF